MSKSIFLPFENLKNISSKSTRQWVKIRVKRNEKNESQMQVCVEIEVVAFQIQQGASAGVDCRGRASLRGSFDRQGIPCESSYFLLFFTKTSLCEQLDDLAGILVDVLRRLCRKWVMKRERFINAKLDPTIYSISNSKVCQLQSTVTRDSSLIDTSASILSRICLQNAEFERFLLGRLLNSSILLRYDESEW